MKIVLLTPGCFDRGGISRYTRYQILALFSSRQLDCQFFSILGPRFNPIEPNQSLPPVHCASDCVPTLFQKSLFILRFLFHIFKNKPQKVLLCHVNFLILAPIISFISKESTILLNIYGLEVWSSKRDRLKFFSRFLDYVISDCHNTLSYFSRHISNSIPSAVIWDCVDKKLFSAHGSDLIDIDRFGTYIATMGRLSQRASHKGYVRLIDTFEFLLSRFPHLHLVFIGDGDFLPCLQEIVKLKDLSRSIHFLGFLSDEQAGYCLSNARVFSLVSECGMNKGEGIPLTPLEALACGTPIVVGDEDGSSPAK